MNSITELLQSTLQLRSKECLKTYLESCDEYCAFLVKDSSNDSLLKQINALLSGNEDDRHQGLSLLQTYVTQCSVRVFSENAVNWLLHCLKISLNKDAPDTCSLSLHLFKTILGMSVKFPEVAKEVAKQVVPKFLLEHVKRRQKQLVATIQVLQCVEVCMKNYGGPTGEFHNDISNIVCHLLESGCATVAIASKCFALLPHVGSGGSQGVTHKTAWGQQQSVVVSKIHDILDDMFANINEIQTYSKPKIELPGIVLNIPHHGNPSPVVRAQRLTKQFAGLAQFLQAMLLGEFSVAKTVMPGIIMGVVCRCLAVTHAMLSNKVSMDSQALMAVLPLLHKATLQTLDALILCCGRNLILYGRTICRLIAQVIKSTSTDDWPYAINMPHRSLRVTVLKTLNLWLTVAQCSSSVEIYAEDILMLLLKDIQSEKQSVTLNLAKKGPKEKKSNKRQSLSLSLSGQDHSEKLGNVLANRHLCAAALNAIQNILQVASVSIKPELHKMVQRIVLGLIIKITQSCNNNDMPIPYSDTKCRLSLYQLLHTLCTEPHPLHASPIQYAVHLFSAGLKDPDVQVQSFCQKSLSSIDKIIRPNAPSLSFSLQPTEHQLHNTVHLNSDLNRPLSSIANKDGLILLRLVQEGGNTVLEPAKNMMAENMRRFSNENNVTTADYQPATEPEGIVISNLVSINSEEQEACMETEDNYYGEEYEIGNEEDDGGGGDGDDVDDEENYNYEENGDEEDDGGEAGEEESDVEVICVSSGGEQEEEEEDEEEDEDIGEEEEEVEEEEEEEEECTGVEKHIDDEEDNELHRLAAKREYNSIEIRPIIVEKRSLHFEEEREQKRFKPSQENLVSVGEPIQVLQPEQLNKNVCGKNEFVKPNSGSVKHENEGVEVESKFEKTESNLVEPENSMDTTGNDLVEPENNFEKTGSNFIESESRFEKTENDIVEPENGFEKAESDNIEPENGFDKTESENVEPENGSMKVGNDFVEPENVSMKVGNDFVEPENGSMKVGNDFVEPENEVEHVKCKVVDKSENDCTDLEIDSVKTENDSVEPENESVEPGNDFVKPENDIVQPDMNMEIDNVEEETIVKEGKPELQQEPEAKKTDKVVTNNETENEIQQSEPNGCVQSIMEGESNKQNEEESKDETKVVPNTEENADVNETEVDSEHPNQQESPSIKETVSKSTTVEDIKSNNIENSKEKPDDEKPEKTKCNNNKENVHSSENDIVEKKLEVSKNGNTTPNEDDDDSIDEEKMIKDFADVVESL